MMRRRRLSRKRALSAAASSAAILIGAAFVPGITSASAQSAVAQQQVSGNWSGYVVRSKAGKNFSSVSGSWVQPSVSSTSGQGYAAFWVGLGGASDQSQSLEQVGTAAQVVGGQTSYYAWYELVPSAQVTLKLAIHPGDHMSGKVNVDGTSVTISLSDNTTRASVTKTLQMSSPDTSSAEWIAESPAAQLPDGSMQILPLADFGQVSFTQASATAGGHSGSITDSAWTVDQVALNSDSTPGAAGNGGSLGVAGQDVALAQQRTGASAGNPSAGGSAFTVAYSAGGSSGASSYPSAYSNPGGYGYPSGYGGTGGYGYPGAYVYIDPAGNVYIVTS